MTRVPQLILSLNSQGKLVIELPGPMATRRQVEVREAELASTALRILRAQQEERVDIGLDGAPTQAQVLHWERHETWPDGRCRFCLAEGRAKSTTGKPQRRFVNRGDGVEVRKVAAGTKGQPKPQAPAVQSSDELFADLGSQGKSHAKPHEARAVKRHGKRRRIK